MGCGDDGGGHLSSTSASVSQRVQKMGAQRPNEVYPKSTDSLDLKIGDGTHCTTSPEMDLWQASRYFIMNTSTPWNMNRERHLEQIEG